MSQECISWRYRLLLLLISPALVLYTAWVAMRGGGLRYFSQRLMLQGFSIEAGAIWVHAASVGEVNAAVPLIHAMKKKWPGRTFIITTMTPTGAEQANRVLPEVMHHYLPLDYRFATRKFLRKIQPCCAIIMETEIWPWLFQVCASRGVPLVIANARLSERTTNKPAWVRGILSRALRCCTAILARSEEDKSLYLDLGANPETTTSVGNIKYAQQSLIKGESIHLPRPFVLAASTHHDEESRLAKLWMALSSRRNHVLVIAPRHPKRSADILKEIASTGAVVATRSQGQPIDDNTDIYLADTLGELRGFIAGAEAVFVGGSLIPRGGQNLLEVASAGKAPICGPSMYNFSQEYDLLQKAGAAFMVQNEQELGELLEKVLDDKKFLVEAGKRGRLAVGQQKDIAGRYVRFIADYCR